MMPNSAISAQTSVNDRGNRARRKRHQPDSEEGNVTRKQISKLILIMLGMAILIAGMLIGVFYEKRRHRVPEVVAVVNGSIINKSSFYEQLENVAGDQTIHRMVGEELQLQFARAKAVAPADAAVAAKFAEASRQPGFEQQLQRNHQTPAMYQRSLRIEMAKAGLLTQGVQVTEAEIRSYYAAQSDHKNPTARYYRPEMIQIAVVVTAEEAKARQALNALQNGLTFADVAQKYSQDQSKANGGIMPPFARGRVKSSQIPGFEDAIFDLKIGQQFGPRRFAGAWWIIKCLDKSAEQTVPYEKVREECRTGALLTKGARINGKRLATEFVDFQHHATIQAFWQKYADVVSIK